MAPVNSFTGQSKPYRSAKRKRGSGDGEDAQRSGKENGPPTQSPKLRQTRQASTVNSAARGKITAVISSKESRKLYTDTLTALDKRVDELDKKVKIITGIGMSITTSTYAVSARKYMGTFKKLVAMDTTLAFNLLLSMADASHTDLDATCKMCGSTDDESVPTFKLLDEALLPLIEARQKPADIAAELADVPKRWTRKDADVGVFKTGRPNKQQRDQMYRQKLSWEKNRRQARRQRRENAENWVKVSLSDLVEERDYLARYGVGEYLPKCIAMLEEVVKAREE